MTLNDIKYADEHYVVSTNQMEYPTLDNVQKLKDTLKDDSTSEGVMSK